MDALDTTIRLVDAKREKTTLRMGFGDTDEGIGFAEILFDEHLKIFSTKIEESKKHKGVRGVLRKLIDIPSETVTALALNAGIAILMPAVHCPLSAVLRSLGKAAYMECYGRALLAHNELEAKRIEAKVRYRHGSLEHRRAALRGYGRKINDFHFDPWSDKERMVCGKWLLEGLLQGSAFVLNDKHLDLTPEALATLESVSAEVILRRLVGVPMTGQSLEWTEGVLHIPTPEGVPLPYSLVRSYQKPVRSYVERGVRSGQAKPVLEALNAIQGVRWAINRPIVDLVKACHELGVSVPGLPSRSDIPAPEKPAAWEDMTDGQRQVWKRKANEIATANRGFIGERIVLFRDIATAEYLADCSDFWIPHNLDYRGRVYGIPHFQFQRQDYVRAMFRFAEGQPVDAEGLYWLRVHVANCGDFKKVSKQPFDDRVWWTQDNEEKLLATAAAPLDDLWWTEADKPFLFVAGCMALRDALAGKPVHIPVSFDGSCSGLQHLAAMSRCEDTSKLVNLVNNRKPADIYQTVADRVQAKVQTDLTSTEEMSFRNKEGEVTRTVKISDLAQMLMDYGITRSLVKRNVMTYSYSSKRSGMQDQILEDTMRPLQLQVLAGEIPKHPFGDDEGYAAARYLSGVTYQSIVETVKRPAVVMKYLQDIAGAMAHQDKCVYWTTPLGFPVMLRCPHIETTQVNLMLHDRGLKVRLQPRTNPETGGLDKVKAKQAVSPSFVHSYDACHLMMVVLEARKEGINSVALVHDSFGCHPNYAKRFREIIKETFVELYANNNPLEQIRQENCVHLVSDGYRLPDVPAQGSLDIQEVTHAEYSFA